MKLERLKKGNSKLHNVWIYDLPAIKTCLNCSTCKDTCYAMKAQRQYPNVINWRNENYKIAKNGLVKSLSTQLDKISLKDNQVVRLHSSGDFFNQAYINKWYKLIIKYPTNKFYAYTKVNEILDFSDLVKLPNFNLISSFIGKHLNYGNNEHIEHLKAKYNAFICPATQGKDIKCNLDCKYCITGNKPVFKIH